MLLELALELPHREPAFFREIGDHHLAVEIRADVGERGRNVRVGGEQLALFLVVLNRPHHPDDLAIAIPHRQFVREEPRRDPLAAEEEFDDLEHGHAGADDAQIILAELFGETAREQFEIGHTPEVLFVAITIEIEEGAVRGEEPALAVLREEEDTGEMVEKEVEGTLRRDRREEGVSKFGAVHEKSKEDRGTSVSYPGNPIRKDGNHHVPPTRKDHSIDPRIPPKSPYLFSMSTDYDPDETLAAYGYGSKPGKGKTIAIVLLTLLLLAAAGGAGFLGKLWSDEQSKSLDLERQVKTFQTVVSELEGKNAELSSLLADKQAESERLQQEWTTQVETLKKEHAEQLQRTYAQMNDILYDSRSTLEYIGDIETRLKSGQKIDREEAAKLTGVINGLAFLHQQYGKPLNEFRELDRYFSRQIASLPADQVDPKETASPLKKIFKNKEFKEERDTFLENQGRRDALVEARSTVSAAYASAQKQMADISLDINQYLAQLQQIVDSNEAAGAEVDAFFEKSKEILKIHDRIMSIEPPKTQTVRP